MKYWTHESYPDRIAMLDDEQSPNFVTIELLGMQRVRIKEEDGLNLSRHLSITEAITALQEAIDWLKEHQEPKPWRHLWEEGRS